MNRKFELDASAVSPEIHALIRRELGAAGFSEETLKPLDANSRQAPWMPAKTFPIEPVNFHSGQSAQASALPAPLAALVRLLLLEEPTPLAMVRASLSETCISALQALGVVTKSGAELRAEVLLVPWRGTLLACDRETLRDRPEYVFRPHHSTSAMEAFVRPLIPRSASLLDVGTGTGALAILYGQACPRVVANDINPRAIDLTAFNAALNGVTIDIELGDSERLPLAQEGRRFDLIAFAAPLTFDVSESPAWGLDEGAGLRLVEEFYANVGSSLTPDGVAFLRHCMVFEPADFHEDLLRRTGAAEELTVTFVYAAADIGAWIAEQGGVEPDPATHGPGTAIIQRRRSRDEPVLRRVRIDVEHLTHPDFAHWLGRATLEAVRSPLLSP